MIVVIMFVMTILLLIIMITWKRTGFWEGARESVRLDTIRLRPTSMPSVGTWFVQLPIFFFFFDGLPDPLGPPNRRIYVYGNIYSSLMVIYYSCSCSGRISVSWLCRSASVLMCCLWITLPFFWYIVSIVFSRPVAMWVAGVSVTSSNRLIETNSSTL